MVTAKEFWEYLCEDLNYRFFAGVSCKGLKPLYDKMSSKFMHYVPAVDERVAVGVVTGARLAGIKGAVLMRGNNILDILNLLISFNKKYKVPILIICYDDEYYWSKQRPIIELLLGNFKVMKLDDDVEIGNTFKDNINIVTEDKNKSGILFIGKEDLK
jgi:hypothetical protein